MEGSVVLVLVLVVLVGGLTLMLAVGYASTEQERARRESTRRPAVTVQALPAALPAFFDASRPAAPIAFVFDDGLVHRVEAHVRGERAMAAEFIHQPSVEALYRRSGSELRAN